VTSGLGHGALILDALGVATALLAAWWWYLARVIGATAGPSGPAVAVHGTCDPARKESDVANPWTKKNPLLSMWLSGANAGAGKARAASAAEAGRQLTDLARQAARLWSGAWLADTKPEAKPKPKRRR
jgi:hypothetical protein